MTVDEIDEGMRIEGPKSDPLELDNGKSHEGPKSDPPEPLPEPGVGLAYVVGSPSCWPGAWGAISLPPG